MVEVALEETTRRESGDFVEIGDGVLDLDLTDTRDTRLLLDKLELEGLEVVRQDEVFIREVLGRSKGKVLIINI